MSRKIKNNLSILKSDRTLFTVAEVRRELRLSRSTAYRYIVGDENHKPIIPSVRLGRLLRIPRYVVQEIVNGRLPLAASVEEQVGK